MIGWMYRHGAPTWQLANTYFSVVPQDMNGHPGEFLIDAGFAPGSAEFATLSAVIRRRPARIQGDSAEEQADRERFVHALPDVWDLRKQPSGYGFLGLIYELRRNNRVYRLHDLGYVIAMKIFNYGEKDLAPTLVSWVLPDADPEVHRTIATWLTSEETVAEIKEQTSREDEQKFQLYRRLAVARKHHINIRQGADSATEPFLSYTHDAWYGLSLWETVPGQRPRIVNDEIKHVAPMTDEEYAAIEKTFPPRR